MKNKLAQSALCMFIGGVFTAQATVINIPDGSFEGVSTTVKVPTLLGTTTGSIGAWSAQASSLVSATGALQSGTATAVGGPTPANGAYELSVNLPLSVGTTATLSQVLTNAWLPDSTYTLTVSLDQAGIANLLSGTTLALTSNGTNVASLSSATLLGLLNSNSTFQTVTLVCKTGNTAPAGQIGISLASSSTLSASGKFFVDNFALSVVPTQVSVTCIPFNQGTNSSVNVIGTGGAPGQTFKIVTITNLALCVTNWTCCMTNTFDSSGNFAQKIAVDRTVRARFFRLVLP